MKLIEAVQRQATKFWQQAPGTVTNLLNDLDWPTLQNRRKSARLTLLHKAMHGESALEILWYTKERNCQLRSFHSDKFIELKPNTEAYRHGLILM